jgi:hypothetical protein
LSIRMVVGADAAALPLASSAITVSGCVPSAILLTSISIRPEPEEQGIRRAYIAGSGVAWWISISDRQPSGAHAHVVGGVVGNALRPADPLASGERVVSDHIDNWAARVDHSRLSGEGSYVVQPACRAEAASLSSDTDHALDDSRRAANVVGAWTRPAGGLGALGLGTPSIGRDVLDRHRARAWSLGVELEGEPTVAALRVSGPAISD